MDNTTPDSTAEQAARPLWWSRKRDAAMPGDIPARPSDPRLPWRQSRYAFAAVHFIFLVFVWLVLRFVLVLKFSALSTLTPIDGWHIFLAGLQRDAFMGLAFTIPMLFWFWLLPNS